MKKFASMQSFFLAFIIYSSLAFSLLLSFFFWDAFDHFSSLFWCVVSLPLFALEDKTRNIIPPKETHPAAFSPAHTLQVRDFSPRKRLFLSLTHSCGALFALFSFLAEDISRSSSFVVWISKKQSARRKIISSGRRSVFLDTLSARVSLLP
jgi:hypothetical protein|tara:strand:- start:155 stop:607 length:453 start_codon:yes stop_codon:yes gene_type:complete